MSVQQFCGLTIPNQKDYRFFVVFIAEYLLAKAPDEIAVATLGFEGRDKVVYRRPKT
jgi:hypothetical protein